MNKESLHEPFSIIYKTLDECGKQAHQHSFFELVYIVSGTGTQTINKSQFIYREGHMFLITPEDCHFLEVATTTTFFFLRFNNIYLKEGGLPKENIQRLEFILQNANHRPGCILKNQTDKLLVRPMIEAIIREYANRDIYNKELIQQLVNTLIIVVARNIAKYQQLEISEHTEEKALNILHYLQRHIYEPSKLRAQHIKDPVERPFSLVVQGGLLPDCYRHRQSVGKIISAYLRLSVPRRRPRRRTACPG